MMPYTLNDVFDQYQTDIRICYQLRYMCFKFFPFKIKKKMTCFDLSRLGTLESCNNSKKLVGAWESIPSIWSLWTKNRNGNQIHNKARVNLPI